MGNANIRRYMGGKRPEKFFTEDLWPSHMETLMKLGMLEKQALNIFLVFCEIDVDESESVDVDEAFGHMGGVRTRFTERIFDIKDRKNAKDGLPYGPFSIVLWNYCTYTPKLMARHLWEIYDIDGVDILEKPDIESMYRMMYDCDDYEYSIIKRFPFNDEDCITKEEFINHASGMFNQQLIKPALDYQKRLKRYLGGYQMWDTLTKYRKKWFTSFDEASDTLEEALNAILDAENLNSKMRIEDNTEKIIAQEKAKLQEQIAEAKRAQTRRETQLALQLKTRVNPQQRKEKQLEVQYKEALDEFAGRKFILDDIWERRELRDELFEMFDAWWELKDKNRLEANERNLILAKGSEEDRQAMYEDHLATKSGKHEYNRRLLKEILIILEKRYPPREPMTIKEAQRVSNIIEYKSKSKKMEMIEETAIKKAFDQTHDNPLDPKRPDLDMLLGMDMTVEFAFAKMTASSSDIKQCSAKVEEELKEAMLKRDIEFFYDDEKQINLLAEKEKRRTEFELITGYGSRDTRWEFVYDPEKEVYVYVNVDTMQILPDNTAICEMCDAIYQHESIKKCECGAPRSMKNMKFYKPLGY